MDDASVGPTVVPLDFLREITNGFSEEQELGSGSFGKVYLGVCQDGEKVAVKKLYDMPGLDDKQFLNEFNNLRRVQHKNIVRLVGYCHDIQEVHVMYQGKLVLAEKTHRALCLEYISNGSLDKYLSDECDRYNWQTCYRIIKGICQGLKYLHNELKPPIYHLDLKPANILLDENMVPRIADFGISRLFGDEHTLVTNSTLGTLGYSPPEFIRSNLISNKFDIFSFGVVIIKMMAGRAGYWKSTEMSSHEFTNLVQENWTSRLLETSNRRNAYSEQIKICIEIGLSCVQEDRHRRPTIQDIVYILEKTETKCNYAARKDWSLIFQPGTKLDKNLTEEAHRNTFLHYAPDPNDRHAQQIHHGSTVDDEKELLTETPENDRYHWRKYGEKKILNADFPRLYYRCGYSDEHKCPAKKYVQQQNYSDPPVFKVTLISDHTCHTLFPAEAGQQPPSSSSSVNLQVLGFTKASLSSAAGASRMKEEEDVAGGMSVAVPSYTYDELYSSSSLPLLSPWEMEMEIKSLFRHHFGDGSC